MASLTIGPGKVRLAWMAPTTTFATLPWVTSGGVGFYNATVLNGINRISANGLGYSTNKPSSGIKPFTTFEQAATGVLPNVYELDLKLAITIQDSSLLALSGSTAAAKPVITSLSASSRAPGELLNITGTGFTDVLYVLLGNTAVQINRSSLTSTQVTVTVPSTATAASNVPVVVITAAGASNVVTSLSITTATTTPPTTYTNGYSVSSYSSAYARS